MNNKFLSGDHIRLIPEKNLEFLGRATPKMQSQQDDESDYYKVDLNPLRENPLTFTDSIKITPWQGEHYATFCLMKLKLYCEKHGIKVIANGTMNYLPALSLIADEVYLEGDPDLSALYKHKSCILHRVNLTRIDTDSQDDSYFCPRCERVLKEEEIETSCSGNRIRKNPFFNALNIPWARVRNDYTIAAEGDVHPLGFKMLMSADREIGNRDVIERYRFPETFIMKSTWDLFWKLKNVLARNLIWVESRRVVTNEKMPRVRFPFVGGRGDDAQARLINMVGTENYMSFQLLGSTFSNWVYLCREGSSNILAFLPVKSIVLAEHLLRKYIDIPRGFALWRYGKDWGTKMPLLSHKRNFDVGFIEHLQDNQDLINEFIEAMEYTASATPSEKIMERFLAIPGASTSLAPVLSEEEKDQRRQVHAQKTRLKRKERKEARKKNQEARRQERQSRPPAEQKEERRRKREERRKRREATLARVS